MSPGLSEWPWTRRLLTLFHSCSIFSCSWLLLVSLRLLIYESLLLPVCSCSSAVGLTIRRLRLSVRLLVQLLWQRPRCSAIQGSSPPGHHATHVLNVLLSGQPEGAVLASFIKQLPTHPHAHGPVCTREKRKWGAGSFLLRVWPRSEICHFHSFPIG